MHSRFASTSAAVVLVVSCGCAGTKGVVDRGYGTTIPVSGFTTLATPRAWIPIGSIWNDNIGAAGAGLDSSRIRVTRSLDEAAVESEGTRLAAAKIGLLRLLGVDGSRASAWKDSVYLAQLEIVSVGDFHDLELSAGTDYVWEGLRVARFEVRGMRVDTTAVRAALDSSGVGRKVTLSVGQAGNQYETVKINGANLFIGIRVIGFADAMPTSIGRAVETPSRRILLGSEYELRFATAAKESAASSCRGVMTARYARKWVGVRPFEKRWQVACTGHSADGGTWSTRDHQGSEDGRFELDAYETSGEFRVDELVLDGVYFVGGEGWVEGAGNFRIERRTMKKEARSNPRAPGWTE